MLHYTLLLIYYILLFGPSIKETRVRSSVGLTKRFPARVGVHQGTTPSPYLFNIVTDALTAGVRETPPPIRRSSRTISC